MDGKCLRKYLQMALNWKKMHVNLIKRLYKIIMKTGIRDKFWYIYIYIYVKHPKRLHTFHSHSSFLLEKMKINKYSKLVCNLYDKKQCWSHKSFKTNITSWSSTKKVHRVIKLNQKAWLKPFIDMNTKLRIEAKNEFENTFLS